MKIIVELLGLPVISAAIGKKTEVDFAGRTVADLVDQLAGGLGAEERAMLLDGEGQLDPSIQAMVNEEGFLVGEELHKRGLKDGDSVRFVPIVGGG